MKKDIKSFSTDELNQVISISKAHRFGLHIICIALIMIYMWLEASVPGVQVFYFVILTFCLAFGSLMLRFSKEIQKEVEIEIEKRKE